MDFGTPLLLSFEDEASLLSAVVVLHMDGCICLQKYRLLLRAKRDVCVRPKKLTKTAFLNV